MTAAEASLTAWQRVQIARHPDRPLTNDYIKMLFPGLVELRGDRLFRDDRAIVGGIARFAGRTIVVVGHQKGRGTAEKVEHNFGSPQPEGFRKALRLMRLAAKFSFPVVTFIDTPGASPDREAEERGQAKAIADNLYEMAGLRVPIVGIVIGEGNSGGALAIGLVDRLLMLEHSYFSVVSPEGCASILWRDPKFAPQAAEAMGITATDLRRFEIIDEVIPEPAGGAHTHPREAADAVREALLRNLQHLASQGIDDLIDCRYARYRAMGSLADLTPVAFGA